MAIRMDRKQQPCDRCGEAIDGFETDHGTMGFYRLTLPSIWARFARSGEKVICDDCMFEDERYRRDYGYHESHRRHQNGPG